MERSSLGTLVQHSLIPVLLPSGRGREKGPPLY